MYNNYFYKLYYSIITLRGYAKLIEFSPYSKGSFSKGLRLYAEVLIKV